MFEGMKNMAGMAGLMKDLPKMKEKMEQVKKELGDLHVTAETGGGAVRATATGAMRIVSIDIEPALMAGLVDPSNPDDQAMAQDLIAGATNAALEKAREAAEQRLSEAAGELGLPIPPGGLGGLMQ